MKIIVSPVDYNHDETAIIFYCRAKDREDYMRVYGIFDTEQFEIIGLGISNSGLEVGVQPYKPEHKKYRKEIQKRGAVDGDLYMMKNGIVEVPYARILIRNKKI